jgi:hypothetical protein
MALPASSQSRDAILTAFAGAWRIYDAAYVNGGPCTIALSRNPLSDGFEAFGAEQAFCGGDLDRVASWAVSNGQLVLQDQSRQTIARLGGNQQRISGEMANGRTVILERTRPGDPEPVTPDCLYEGYGDDCATNALRAPLDTDAGPVQAQTLVALNLRDQPRPSAQIVSTVEQGACLVMEECRTASDGPWCRTTVGGSPAWARRHAVRLETFPVLTYRPGC